MEEKGGRGGIGKITPKGNTITFKRRIRLLTTAKSDIARQGMRLYFLDHLRSFIIIVVLLYHAALAYMVRGPQWYYVIDTQNSFLFNVIVTISDVFVMPTLFFLAGFFGIRSLIHTGSTAFWRSKVVRIVFPYFVGIIFLAPAVNYIYFLSRVDTPPAYLNFWGNVFFGLARQHAHLWFLGVLTIFFLGLSLIHRFYKPLDCIEGRPSLPSKKFIIGFALATSIAFFCAKQFMDDFTWVMIPNVLMFQPTRCTLYVFYFMLGVYAYRKQWFAASGYMPNVKFWMPLAVVLGGVYAQYRIALWPKRDLALVMIGNDLLYGFFCLAAVFGLVALFHQRMNYTSDLLSKLAKNSYAIYFIHQPVLMLSILAVREYQLPVVVKYVLSCAVALLICFFVSELFLSKLTPFGGRKKRAVLVDAKKCNG